MNTKQKLMTGLTSGLLNGLFGSGGGVAAVPLLERSKLEQRKCHATSVVLIFVLSLFSAGMYALNGSLDYAKAAEFIPAGLLGALVGAGLLKKIKNDILKRVFGAVILISAIRMFIV
ncbi:MAG: sulfite exporter TauE/SafE family protein [Oscillospiraceae bacterium]|nr:sulfite exporter TauE/SafE family protein [Oscillospiraceae bacterium]